MKIVVVGSLKKIQFHEDICIRFVVRLGETIAARGYTLLTGCRGSLDKHIAEAAYKALKRHRKQQIVSYHLKHTEPAHRYGTIHISSLKDWDLTHPELSPPEQIAKADVAIFVGGSEGTFIAANWARIAGITVLGVAQFGGAGQKIFHREYESLAEIYSNTIEKQDLEILNEDSTVVDRLAADVIDLAERIVMPRTVFPILSFTDGYRGLLRSWRKICKREGFDLIDIEESEATERIIPKIFVGIRRSAFLIADVTVLESQCILRDWNGSGPRQESCRDRKGSYNTTI
jgi:hypothetical protein